MKDIFNLEQLSILNSSKKIIEFENGLITKTFLPSSAQDHGIDFFLSE